MENGNQSQKEEWYIKVNGQQVQVTEEVYKAIRSENNHIREMMREEFRCAQANFAHCDGDCQHCGSYVTGNVTSLDELNIAQLAANDDIEAEYIRKDTWHRVCHYADAISSHGADILKLRILYEFSFSTISSILGISRQTVHRKYQKILDVLRSSRSIL